MKIKFTTANETIKNIQTVDLSAKCLPINLGDAINKACSLCSSEIWTSSVYISNNNIIEDYNILYNSNIYTKCPDLTMVKEYFKNKAKGNLVDLHYFPVRYKGSDKKEEESYVAYNLNRSLYVMLQMEKALEWLIGYNEAEFIVETKDIRYTLEHIAHRLTSDESIIKKQVQIAMDEYNSLDKEYIASKFQDYWFNIDLFIGKERWINRLVHYDTYDKDKFIGVYLYGDNREDAWRNVTHRLDNGVCLFFDNNHKMMLKRIKNTMTGQQFHKYMKELVGKWFDVDGNNWTNILKNVSRVDDSALIPEYVPDICKLELNDWMNDLNDLAYDMEIKETTKTVEHISISTTYEDFPKTEDGSTDWSKVEKDHKFDKLEGDDFWEAMSRL